MACVAYEQRLCIMCDRLGFIFQPKSTYTHTLTCIMYIANVLKNCVKKLTYEKCLREIRKFGHKADLRRSSRLKLVVNATSKRPRNEHQVEDDDDDADDNEPEKEEEHWG